MNIIQDISRYAFIAYLKPTKDSFLMKDSIDFIPMSNDVDFAFIVSFSNRIIVSFRGTDNFMGWISDFDFRKDEDNKQVENGFHDSWDNFKSSIIQYLKNYSDIPIYMTGHSRGAALCTIAANEVKQLMPKSNISNINFGSPRVYSKDGAAQYNNRQIPTFRVVNGGDLITEVPLEVLEYQHILGKIQLQQPWYRYLLPRFKIQDHDPHRYADAMNKRWGAIEYILN
jgi:predicted lipase